MKNIKIYFAISFIIVGISCSIRKHPNEGNSFTFKYINIWRNGRPIDTTFMRLDTTFFKDSIYNLKYTVIHPSGDTTCQYYELPISNSTRTFKLLKDTSEYRLKFEGLRYIRYDKDYIVYKYLFDDPNGDDEEMNYYFIPEYGIIIIRSRAWGSYGRLISNSNKVDFDKIFYLTEKIVGDFQNFYFPLRE